MADNNKDREKNPNYAPDKNPENTPQDDATRREQQGQWGRPQTDDDRVNRSPVPGEKKEEEEDEQP